jgi:hypothetical protein
MPTPERVRDVTAKDFRVIVEVIRGIECLGTRRFIADRFATICRRENPNFNRKRFYKACGL